MACDHLRYASFILAGGINEVLNEPANSSNHLRRKAATLVGGKKMAIGNDDVNAREGQFDDPVVCHAPFVDEVKAPVDLHGCRRNRNLHIERSGRRNCNLPSILLSISQDEECGEQGGANGLVTVEFHWIPHDTS